MLSSSDLHHGLDLWFKQFRHIPEPEWATLSPWPHSLFLCHGPDLILWGQESYEALYFGKSDLHSLCKGRCPFLLLSNSICLSPLSFLLHPALFSSSVFTFFPSSYFLILVTKCYPVTTCLMLHQRCRYGDTIGSFIVICDINHLGTAQART